MLQKLEADSHSQPFKGYFTIHRVHPGTILENPPEDGVFGPLSNIDHAFMKKGLTIKMHEHVNDEILSYVWKGVSQHRDSAGFEAPIERGKLMLMNAGESFWHEEKVIYTGDDVEMLQIFVRPQESNLSPHIQFHDKPADNKDWYLMAGPEGSDAPLFVRQNVYIFDAHPKAGQHLEVPVFRDWKPFLYILDGEVNTRETVVKKYEAVTDFDQPLPVITVNEDTTAVLFLVDINAPMSLEGTISGSKNLIKSQKI